MAAACVEEEGQAEYLLALESSDMANLCADVASLGFLGGEGITPGRLLRVAHALTRVSLLTIAGTTAAVHQPADLPCMVSAAIALQSKESQSMRKSVQEMRDCFHCQLTMSL